MLQGKTIARPYAIAVFDIAKQSKTIDMWNNNLSKLSLIIQNDAIIKLIGNPKVNQHTLLTQIQEMLGVSSSKDFIAFLNLLLQNKRLKYLPEISTYFSALVVAESGQSNALIESAFPMTQEQQKKLIEQLELIFKRSLNVIVKIVPDLIGGVRATVGDQVYDYSLKAHLSKMKMDIMSV
jgi:F-type H+-transporting ATPase subunit delta